MKFEYEDKDRSEYKVKAFVAYGHLYIKTDEVNIVMVVPGPHAVDGDDVTVGGGGIWGSRIKDATKKFYKGDSITITF